MRKKVCTVIACIAVILLCVIGFSERGDTEQTNNRTAVAAEVKPSEERIAEDKQEAKEQPANEESQTIQAKRVETKEEVSASSSTESKKQSTKTDKSSDAEASKEVSAHTHNWVPVYAEKTVEKTRQVAWTKCYACGADMTGNISHIDQHLLNHETNVHYGTEYRTEVYYETERYISGYKCECGKTK